jgi:hypothetical protein
MFEDNLEIPTVYLPNVIPHNVINETAFVSLISSFTSEIDIALKLHS